MIITREGLERVFGLLKQTAGRGEEGASVLVLCACDTDSLCCLRILSALLQADDIAYRKRPVRVLEDLCRADEELSHGSSEVQYRSVVLINCGGGVSLREVLPHAPRETMIFVIDSHRPYHPDNVENRENVALIGEEDTEDDSPSSIARPPATKRRATSAELGGQEADTESQARDPEAPHEEGPKPPDIGSFYGPGASLVAFRLAEAVKKERDVNVIWLAIVGCTDQFLHRHIELERYRGVVGEFQVVLASLDPLAGEDGEHAKPQGAIVPVKNDLRLCMLRHWTLYDSMYHSPAFATKLGIWRQNGRHQLEILLARMGVPLSLSKQPFSSMPAEVKDSLPAKIAQCAKSNVVPDTSIFFCPSFEREYIGLRRAVLSCSDVVYASSALLESGREDAFWTAYSSLSEEHRYAQSLLEGIDLAIRTQQDIVAQAAGMLANKSIVVSGPFRYAILSESALLPRFVHPLALTRLCHFVMDALAESRTAKKPFLLCSLDETANSYLIVALTNGPLSRNNKNSVGEHFERAAEKTQSVVTQHSFDSAVLQVHKEDLTKFLDFLHTDLISSDQ